MLTFVFWFALGFLLTHLGYRLGRRASRRN